MRVGIHQLHYLPWLRYVDKIARSDVFIVLDTVQYNKNGWQNRNKVKTASGITLLTVPVHARLGDTLDAIQINEETKWRKRHWMTIEQSYRRAPFFDACAERLSSVYATPWERLNDVNARILDLFVEALGVRTRVVYASSLDAPGEATERLVNLIQAVGGDTYFSGAYAMEQYLDRGLLDQAGIALELQEWRAPTYPQLHGPFVPDLSILDLLMNCGPESLRVLLGAAP